MKPRSPELPWGLPGLFLKRAVEGRGRLVAAAVGNLRDGERTCGEESDGPSNAVVAQVVSEGDAELVPELRSQVALGNAQAPCERSDLEFLRRQPLQFLLQPLPESGKGAGSDQLFVRVHRGGLITEPAEETRKSQAHLVTAAGGFLVAETIDKPLQFFELALGQGDRALAERCESMRLGRLEGDHEPEDCWRGEIEEVVVGLRKDKVGLPGAELKRDPVHAEGARSFQADDKDEATVEVGLAAPPSQILSGETGEEEDVVRCAGVLTLTASKVGSGGGGDW